MGELPASQVRGFLFADLRDYARFVELHGDQAAAELLGRYRLLVREVIGQFDGAEIRTEGDSFYVVFASASGAVNGGLAILEAAAAAARDPGGGIRVGIGVHAGETADTAEGLVGSAVNLAARICALAGPGELLVSDTVRGLTRTFLPVQFVARGKRRLKGIAEPVLVYQVLPPNSAAGAATGESRARRRPGRSVLLAAAVFGSAAFLLSAAVIAGLLIGNGPDRSVATPGPRSSANAGGSPSGDPGASASLDPLAAARERLLAKLPKAVKGACVQATIAGGSAGGAVSLHCTQPFSAAADEVWVDEFSSPDSLAGAFDDAAARAGSPSGDCRTTPRARGHWGIPNVNAGSLLCYQAKGAVWLVWTYDDDRILIRARRGGADWRELYAWWRRTAPFLR